MPSSGTRATPPAFSSILASGVALGSWLAAAMLVVASLPFLLYRAITEDRVLLAGLAATATMRRGLDGIALTPPSPAAALIRIRHIMEHQRPARCLQG
jgi:hypothetical protein